MGEDNGRAASSPLGAASSPLSAASWLAPSGVLFGGGVVSADKALANKVQRSGTASSRLGTMSSATMRASFEENGVCSSLRRSATSFVPATHRRSGLCSSHGSVQSSAGRNGRSASMKGVPEMDSPFPAVAAGMPNDESSFCAACSRELNEDLLSMFVEGRRTCGS